MDQSHDIVTSLSAVDLVKKSISEGDSEALASGLVVAPLLKNGGATLERIRNV